MRLVLKGVMIVAVLALLLLTVPSAYAATKTFTVAGNFSTAASWGGTLPVAGDDLVIAANCTVDAATNNLAYGTLTIGNSPNRTLSWPVSGTNTLNVSNVSAGANNGALDMTNGGTLIIRGTWTSTNLNFTAGAGTIEIRSTMTLPAAYATYNNLTVNGSGTTVTAGVNSTINNNLAVTSGTFAVGAFSLAVTGTTTVTSTITFNSATGTKTFTGNVVITGTGNWNETAAAVIAFAGNLQNDGTFTAGTGTHTFSGAAKTISGANSIAIPSLTISGTRTNNGTLTVSTTLAGASTLTNGATGTLNFGGASITPPLTATAAGNTVNYYLAGAQTVKATTYSNLILSGSGTKTAAGITTVSNLTVSAGAVFNTGATSTWTLTVSGATSVSGTLTLTNAAAKTFTGDITVNSGGTLSIDNTTSTIIAGNITVSSGGLMNHHVNYVSANIITMTGNLDLSGTYHYTGFAPAIFMNAPSGTRTINTGTTSVFFLLLRTAAYNAVGPVTVDGPFYAMWNVNAGSFHTNGQTIIANWGVVNAGGTLFVDGGSLTINGANGGLLSGFATGGANAAVTVSSGTLNTTGINMGSSPLVSTFTHSGGTITTPYLTIDNTSTFTCSNSPTLTVNGALTLISGTFTTATAGAPAINISGTLAIGSAGTFTNVAASNPVITINGGVTNAGVLTPVGTATINVKGDWTNNGTSTATGGTVTFNGTGNQAIGGSSITTFGSLVINPSAGITVSVTNNISLLSHLTISAGIFNANNFDIAVPGNWTNNAATTGFTAGTGTVTFNGTGAQAIAGSFATTFNNLTISNAGNTVTLGINASVAGNLSVTSGTFDLGAFTADRASPGGTLSTAGTATLKIGGTNTVPSNYSTHSITGISTIEYSGTNQTVVVLNSAQTYQGLTVSGSGTKTLAGDVTVFGNLTLTSGTLTTGAYTLNNVTGAIFRTSGWVNGNLKIRIPTGGAPARLIPVGDATNYTPVNLVFATVTTAGDLTVSVIASDHANIGTSTINAAKSVNRNWTLTNTGTAMVYASYGATFTFVAGDVDGGANTATFAVGKYSAGWTSPAVGAKNPTNTQVTGITGASGFGDFQIGEAIATKTFTGTGNFSTAARWTGGTVPIAGEDIVIDGACTVDNNGGTDNVAYGTLTIGTATGRTLNWAAGGTNRLNVSNVSAGGGAGSLDMTNGGTLIIRGTWASTNLTFTPGAGTIETQSTITLPAAYATYNNLTVNGSGITVSLPATTTVTGNVTITAGTFSANNSNLSVAGNWTNNAAFTAGTASVTFNGSGAQAIGGTSVTTFNNFIFNKPVGIVATLTGDINMNGDLTVTSGTLNTQTFTCNRNSPGGTATVSNSGTYIIGGNNAPAFFGTYALANASTIIWEGTTAVYLPGLVYGNLILRGASAKTLAPGHFLTVNGDLTIESGTTFDSGYETTTINGNWINNGGTFIPNSNAVLFSGTGAQSIGGSSATTFNNLTVSGSSNKTLGRDVNVGGTLLFTAGTITTGAHTLYVNATGSVSRVSGHVIGNLKRFILAGSSTTTFDVGNATDYTPVAVVFNAVTTAGDLTVRTTAGDHATIASSTIDAGKSVNRTWTLTNAGIVSTNYSATFTFVAGNVDASANTADFIMGKFSGGWTYPTVGTKTATTTQATGLTTFGSFQIGEPEPPPLNIWGTVFEDINYGGGDGRGLAASSGVGLASVRVELFNSGGAYISFTTTDGSGNYNFSNLLPGNYTVRVVNGAVTSSRGGTGLLSVQTFRTNASTGTAVDVADRVGGQTPGLADAGNGSTTLAALTTGTTTAQSITSVLLAGGNINGVDFGYSFNAIVNKNNTGQGSLRQFLTNANALSNSGLAQSGLTAGIDNAVFMLADGTAHPGLTASYATQFASGIASITLVTVLPTITDPVVLDASLQPGYANVPMVELNGAAVANAGLTITAGSSTVRGFIINRFTSAAGHGISVSSGASNTITGNYIGTNAAGTAASANSRAGILISSNNNIVGGTTSTARNVISGNTTYGVAIDGAGNTGNLVQGNYIGTNATASSAVANGSHGVYINGAASNTIGGTAANAGNLISGNAGKGVVVAAGTGNAILSNLIYGNTGIGIDLADDGVTANNGTKSGALANSGMDSPVFITTPLAGTTLTLTGYVGSAAGQSTFASASVQVFKSDNDASGFGEGQTLLGTLTTDASGNFSGTLTVSLTFGDKITATATDGSNNTSEFGANATVAHPAPNVALVNSVLPSGTQAPGTDLVYTVVFTSNGGQAAKVFIVTDPIPANTDFKLGSATLSTNLGTTGMTVTTEYSDEIIPVNWNYVPVTGFGGAPVGYDRTVKHVRWRFTGDLSQTSPNNAGSVSFTARIQ